MKIGDKLYCYNTCIISGCNEESLTKGKYYTIIRVTNYELTVLDNNNKRHSFSYYNYKKWLYSKRIDRRNKLKKLMK